MALKIVIAGEVYSDNLGDGVIYHCLESEIKLYGLSVIPLDLSNQKNYATEFTKRDNKNTKLLSFKKIVTEIVKKTPRLLEICMVAKWYLKDRALSKKSWEKIVENGDVVVIGGGQLLSDTAMYFPFRLLLLRQIIKNKNKKYALMGCGLSRSQNLLSKKIYKKLLNDATFVGVRDSKSAEWAHRIANCNDKFFVYPDLAFLSGKFYHQKLINRKEKILLINIQEISNFQKNVKSLKFMRDLDYITFWRDIITYASNDGYDIKVVGNGSRADCYYIEQILSGLTIDNIECNTNPFTPNMLVESISEGSIIISSRMHAGIIAYAMGLKIIPILWDEKINNVWNTADSSVCKIKGEQLLDSSEFYKSFIELKDKRQVNTNVIPRVETGVYECLLSLDIIKRKEIL